MAQLESILISIAFFASTLLLVITILNFILRNRLINSGQNDPEVLKMLSNSFETKSATLKWGIILLFGGIGLVVIYYIPDANQLESPLPYGIEMIFIALGAICYYFAVQQNKEKAS